MYICIQVYVFICSWGFLFWYGVSYKEDRAQVTGKVNSRQTEGKIESGRETFSDMRVSNRERYYRRQRKR